MTDLKKNPVQHDSFKQVDLNQIKDFDIPAIIVHDQSYDVKTRTGLHFIDNNARSDNSVKTEEKGDYVGNCFSPQSSLFINSRQHSREA